MELRLFTRPLAGLIGLLSAAAFTTAASAQTPGAYMGELSWPEAEARFATAPIVIIPFGAGAKEHGPHLPMNADQKVMEYLTDRAVEALPVIVAPPVLHGWMPAFLEFPGTSIPGGDTYRQYMLEIAEVLVSQGAKRIVFLNTGIDRATGLPLSMVAREVRSELKTPTLVLSWGDLESEETEALQEQEMGGHGDELETSIHLFLQPDLVNMDLAVKDYGRTAPKDYPGYRPGLFSRDPDDPAYSETGIFGDATLATREKGQRALEIMTENLIRALRGFSEEPLVAR